ncbi:MAG: TolC family protein [Nitrospirae bacterium]|nr:TolC family protein [Nitrospirota bacterium]
MNSLQHKLLVISAFIYLAISPVISRAADPAQTESLQSLVETALASNAEIGMAQSRARMFENRVGQAGSLDDPMLMFKFQNGVVTSPFDSNLDATTAKVIGISQMFPYGGKLELKKDAARYEAEAYRYQADERKIEITLMVSEAYYRIYMTRKMRGVTAKTIAVLDDIIKVAETRYSVGQAMPLDVYKARIERAKMEDMLISLDGDEKADTAALNAVLFRPADTPVGVIADFGIEPLAYSADDFKKIALENRPALKALGAMIEKKKADVELARREKYPDFTLSFEYMQRVPNGMDDGYDMYSLGLSFNLPIRKSARAAMIGMASSDMNMTAAERAAAENTIAATISDALARMDKRRRQAEHYRTSLIPRAQAAVESARISYGVGKLEFTMLADSLMALQGFERDYYSLLADYMMQRSRLEAAVGGRLDNDNK